MNGRPATGTKAFGRSSPVTCRRRVPSPPASTATGNTYSATITVAPRASIPKRTSSSPSAAILDRRSVLASA